jgi:methyl-accepting chemotaxis protein
MSIQDDLPKDPEIDQFKFDKDSASAIQKLASLEDNVKDAFKDLGEKMAKSNSVLNSYIALQKEMSRQYIQCINQDSDLVNKQDLQKLKQHIEKVEITAENQDEISNIFKEMANGYNEYSNSLKDMGKIWQNISKKQNDWHNEAHSLRKAKDKNATGGKLDKIERNIQDIKGNVVKLYGEKDHKFSFVQKGFLRVNQAWQKLKQNIKNIAW